MQRVAIARALVNNPDILLADEPTGALDTETSVQIMEILKEISKDRLIVMVTHNPDLAESYSTRIIRLLDGRMVDDSNPYHANVVQAIKRPEAPKAKKENLYVLCHCPLAEPQQSDDQEDPYLYDLLCGQHRHHRHCPHSLPVQRRPAVYQPGGGGDPLQLPHCH